MNENLVPHQSVSCTDALVAGNSLVVDVTTILLMPNLIRFPPRDRQEEGALMTITIVPSTMGSRTATPVLLAHTYIDQVSAEEWREEGALAIHRKTF